MTTRNGKAPKVRRIKEPEEGTTGVGTRISGTGAKFSVEAMRAELDLHDPRSPSRLTEDERVYDMKIAGHSVREIAAGCMLPQAEVEATINRCAEQSRSRLAAELSIATILEIDRMDRLLKALWPQAEAGDFGASDRVQAISKERRRVMGIDAPEVKMALNVNSGNEIDLSPLSLDQLKQWEDIQSTLSAAKAKNATPKKGAAGSRYKTIKAAQATVIDVPVSEP